MAKKTTKKIKTNKLRLFVFSIIIAALLLLSACTTNKNPQPTAKNTGEKITVFKSQSCGCCDIYISYLKKQGFNVEQILTDDMDAVKEKYNIPYNMQSCHTSVIGGYFVEGHMPVEAINKMMEAKPDIKGITLPGMPSGSPGMPGKKTGPFVVYSINAEGTQAEFMRI